ncbi:unnamed protein product [Knipowitschia caucasica]
MSEFKGKNLDQIDIDPHEELHVDNESDSEDEDDTTGKNTTPSTSPAPSSSQSSDSHFKVNKKSSNAIGQIGARPAQGGLEDGLEEKEPLQEVTARPKAKGKVVVKKRKWTEEEIQAVEKTLMDCIRTLKVPGKAQCLECINASQTALKGRTWEGVKFYVKNRIDALKRESSK